MKIGVGAQAVALGAAAGVLLYQLAWSQGYRPGWYVDGPQTGPGHITLTGP